MHFNNSDEVIRYEAEKLVSYGVFETVEEAWDEAYAICLNTDAFECLVEYDDEEDDDEY